MSEEEKDATATPAGDPAPAAETGNEPSTADAPALQPVALVGESRACRGAARALARKRVGVRVLCADQTEANGFIEGLGQGPGALSPDEHACVSTPVGRIESDSDLNALLDNVSGVALLSPVELDGRTWRPNSHLDDVRSVVEAVSNRRIARVVYLSSVGASVKVPVRCLREAAAAEKLVSDCGSTEFLLRTGPVIGHGDPWMTRILRNAAAAWPFAVVGGYGDTPFQPIHEDDLGACIARCLLGPSGEMHAGTYVLASTPPAHMLNLLDRAAKQLGRWPKARLHIPLFLLALNVRFRKLVSRDNAWVYADRVGLLRYGLVAEKNDLAALMGPDCQTRPLTLALEEAAAAMGLTAAAQTS